MMSVNEPLMRGDDMIKLFENALRKIFHILSVFVVRLAHSQACTLFQCKLFFVLEQARYLDYI